MLWAFLKNIGVDLQVGMIFRKFPFWNIFRKIFGFDEKCYIYAFKTNIWQKLQFYIKIQVFPREKARFLMKNFRFVFIFRNKSYIVLPML